MWKGVLISWAFYSLESKRHRRVMGRKNKDPGSYLMLDSLNTLATWVQSFMYIYIIFIFIPFTLLLKSFHWNPNSESSVVFWEQYEFVFESEPKEGVSLSSTSVFTGGATPDWHRDKCVCVVFASVHTGTQYYTCCADTKQDAVCTNSAVHKTVTLSNGLYNTEKLLMIEHLVQLLHQLLMFDYQLFYVKLQSSLHLTGFSSSLHTLSQLKHGKGETKLLQNDR